MSPNTQKLVLTVPSSKMAAVLKVLQQFEAVKVDNLADIIKRYVRNAPKKSAINEEEIADILMESRYGKSAPNVR
ncbi:MAG: hypothetical protein ACKVU0_10020 [Saprospiraceae bacterium]